MAIQFNIDYVESSNITMSSQPVVSWRYYDSDSNAVQTGAWINLYNVDTNTYYAQDIKPNGNDAFSQSYKCPVLKPGYYRFGLRVRGDYLITEGITGWSSEYYYYFYVTKWVENEIRWESNDTSINSFNKWFNFTNLDINTNSERIKLTASGITYLTGDYVTEYRIQNELDVAWQTISINKSCPSDTAITLYARASSEPMLEDDTPSWIEITDNNLSGLMGEYLQIKCTLKPDSSNSLTPILNSILITYLIPAKSATETKTINCDLTQGYLYNNTELVNSSIQLKTLGTDYTYVSSGILSTLFDAGMPVVYTSLNLTYTTPGDSALVVKSRLYNNPNNKPDFSTSIIPVGTIFTLPYQSFETGAAKLYQYCEIMFEFTASTDFTESPSINSMKLNYSDIIDTTTNYFYSTVISFPSNITKIFYTGNDNNLTTSFCNVEYGITLTDSKNWDDYTIYEKNKLIDAIAVQSNSMRIGVKLSSNSLVYYPILHELGFIVETENGDKIYLNA
jgi:hypothetical protein